MNGEHKISGGARPVARPFPFGERIVRPIEMAERLGVSVSTLYEWLANPEGCGVPLPRPRQVGPRAVGWPASVVDDFIRALPDTPALPRSKRKKAQTAEAA